MVRRIARRRPRLLLLLVALVACDGGLPPEQRPIPVELPPAERAAARRLPLDGASNFRDLGGYRTRDGHRVRWGLLYRSDALGDLSDDDVAYLARLRLRRVVDFRSPAEREREPDRLPPGPRVDVLSIFGEALDPRALQDEILAGEVRPDRLAGLLVEANRAFVTEFRPQYREFLAGLADPDQLPALFHCTAGKDRAGFGAAVALLALGVARETVMEDYLLTNGYTREKTRRTLRLIRFASLFRSDPSDVRPLFEARPSYLEAAFDAIDAEYGSTDAYLRRGLGLDDATRARLRANLLVPAGPRSDAAGGPGAG